MLVLFDIDGTLLRTGGAGIRAMEDAGRDLFGPTFKYDGIETAGRLDTLIWDDLARLNGIDNTSDNHDRFRRRYGERLAARLEVDGPARLMPGVRHLVHALVEMPQQVTLGLLTGNYPETGRLKIASAGLDPDLFRCNAWGCDAVSRRDLPPIAMGLHRQARGCSIESSSVVIIGDTPHDIDCAKAHGCRCLAVATGAFDMQALEAHGPDLALRDLSETAAVLRWLVVQSAAAVSA